MSLAPRSIRIVGVGASAGGLEPLGQFVAGIPALSGLAYVVVQHMDPRHKALLGELLQRVTSMPVHEARNAQRIEPDTVYVIPPDSELTVGGGALHLAKPPRLRGRRLPIDVLFSSLARELGDRAVGVVLSGMGDDGTLGLQAIKTQGGLTLAQQPDSAQFDAMPKNAIAAGCVDIVALPGEMPTRILGIPSALAMTDEGVPEPAGSAAALSHILGLLHARTRHDLADYKPNTLVRRIGRRMAVHSLHTMADYAAFLNENTQELDLLFKEMLIGVTAFFRDPDIWKDLKDQILPVLLARHAAPGAPTLRAWVAGCSSGEEAYSLAIAFVEILEAMPQHASCTLQIFATDLSSDAIATARSGRFASAIAQDLTPERLARFFTERPDGYQIDKRIRDMVLFAQHDVILDPPFTRLDIISCRNLMIYFSAVLQRRLIPLFHYSLRPGGALLLGNSETVGRAQALFIPLSPKSRLFWRSENATAVDAVVFPTRRRPAARSAAQELTLAALNSPPANLQSVADQLILQTFSPPAVLVNEDGDIIYISGRTGRYLEPAAGKANWNIHVMAHPSIRTPLAIALRTASQDRSSVELRSLVLDDEPASVVDITVHAVLQPPSLDGMVMIVFRDAASASRRRRRRTRVKGVANDDVEDELVRAREEIRALREETKSSHEELQAANEELQSTNEELQSANEELTTSKEEAQSMNEELQTINGELQSKLDDLALAQSDMQNLLNSTDIATLFLDNNFNVRRFTEQMARVVHLREGDIGRPLSELASTLIYPQLHADVKETMRTLAFSEKQIATTDERWYTVRIMPYRTLANVIQGVVITFVDITAAKVLESSLRKG
ncbi:chemotaxis protein CheB [Variovorax sp. W1I1]|uniref:chemotaxis protein CheB n=1 Tax=Variovorax sp. W1I1 TaxID=3042309 RepID=UPI0027D7B237|nr:chemotaxis protein CheB [Variovorax sp. W1I1]